MISINKSRRSALCSKGARAAALAVAFASSTALGQTRESAAARVLFNEARQLASQGRYGEACPKFEESLRLDGGIGTRFNLADCWERVGRTASAWSLFLDVAARAKSSGQADREKVARERAASLEPRLSLLTLRVQARDDGLELRRNDVVVGRALFGTATPVDPGSYAIEARAPGKKGWKTTVTIAPNVTATTVLVPELEKEEGLASAAKVEAPAPSAPAPPVATKADGPAALGVNSPPVEIVIDRSSNSQRTAGWIASSVGLAGVGLGAVYAAMSMSADRKAAGLCTGGEARNECSDDAERRQYEQTTSSAQFRAGVSYGGFIGGGVALLTGVILLITAGSSEPASVRKATTITPLLARDAAGIGLGGVF
jgi:hypothetical protein